MHPLSGFLWLLLSTSVAHAAECPTDPITTLQRATADLEQAYEGVQPEALDAAGAALRTALPCLPTPIEPDAAIAVHRAEALYRFTLYDKDGSTRSWLAVRALAPDYRPPEHWLPDDHPVHSLWNTPPEPWMQRLDSKPPGGWRVDGVPSEHVPTTRAFVLQALDRKGQVLYSGYLLSQAEVPTADWRAKRRRNARIWGSVAASLAAGGALTLTATGTATRKQVLDPRTPDPDLRRLQQQANVQLIGAAGLGAASVATGIVAWSVRW